MKKIFLLTMYMILGMALSSYAALLPLWDAESQVATGYTVSDESSAADTYVDAYFGYTGSDYTGYYIGTIAGNTDPSHFTNVLTFYYETLTGEFVSDFEQYKVDAPGTTDGPLSVTYDMGNLSGTWNLSDPLELDFYAIKGGNEFALYYVDPAMTSGDWTARHTTNPSGTPEISHFSAATTTTVPVPEPASMLLLGAGLFGVAAFGRRRKNRK